MFAFPVTVPFRTDEGVFLVGLTVPIDGLLKVAPLDIEHSFGVESETLYSSLPSCELLFEDGRKLPVMEKAAIINRYLDLYRQLEDFYTAPATPATKSQLTPADKFRLGIEAARDRSGVVVPLFGRSPCATSEALTPD